MQILFFLSITTCRTSDLAVKGLKQKAQRLFLCLQRRLHKINTAIRLQLKTWGSVTQPGPAPSSVKCGVHSVNIMTQNGTRLQQKTWVCRNKGPAHIALNLRKKCWTARGRDGRREGSRQGGGKGGRDILEKTTKPKSIAKAQGEAKP